jgi:hypothetical protein
MTLIDLPVPGYAWLLNHGPKVGFAGVSNTLTERRHPWLCGSDTGGHVFAVGLWTFTPETVLETHQFSGYRLDQLLTLGGYARDIDELVANGGKIIYP